MKGRITKKLLYRVLLAELISFGILMGIAFGFLRPKLQEEALQRAENTGASLAKELQRSLQSMENMAAFIAASPELGARIDSAVVTAQKQQETAGQSRNFADILAGLCEISPLDIRNAVILVENEAYAAYDSLSFMDEGYIHSSWIHLANESGSFSNLYSMNDEEIPDSLAYALEQKTEQGNAYTVLLIYEAGELIQTIDALLGDDYSGYALASQYGPAFYQAGDFGKSAELLEENNLESAAYTLKQKEGYYLVNPVGGWRLCGFLSNQDFNRSFHMTLRYICFMCLLLAVISLAILFPMANGLLKPIFALKTAMDAAQSGDMSARAQVLTGDELGQLAQNFNEMLHSLDEITKQKLEEERKNQEVRYALLISQVNAHFVYNTMSSVNSLIRMGDTDRAVTMNTALLHILQGTLVSTDGALYTSLGRELELLKQYWQIEQIRHEDRISLNIEAEDVLLGMQVPCNILQPIVENSLHHGLIEEETGYASGIVTIQATLTESSLQILIRDNGCGFSEETLESLQREQEDDALRSRGRHIGLSNLRKRLRSLYGEEAGLLVENDGGALVTLYFPIQIN